MKKNVFTKNIQILIIALIILTVILPKEHSQTGMIIFLAIWLTGNLVFKLLNHKESIVVFFRNKKSVKKQTTNTPIPMPHEAKIPTPHPVPESKDITLTETHADIILCHLSLRISDKIKSAYPKAVWQWIVKPSLLDLLNGMTVRISVENMDKYPLSSLSVTDDTY